MSGKSKEEIAFDLVSKLKGVGVWGEQNMQAILDMYAECLEATSGLRKLDGREIPTALLLNAQTATPAKAPATPAPRQTAPQQQPPRPPQPAAQQQAQVRQQQQMLQQAYQQQLPR